VEGKALLPIVILEEPRRSCSRKFYFCANIPAMKDRKYFVYITTNPRKTVLYTGVTNDLIRRMHEHYENRGMKETFAGKFFCYNLIYFEVFNDIRVAIEREKEIKDLSREKKEFLIYEHNPKWNTLKI
jgi:putative endonuclease